MKTPEYLLQAIARDATIENKEAVRELLSVVDYREALLYIEAFHKSSNAKKILQECAFCECGQLATQFPTQQCTNCSLHEGLKKIEYRKP